MTSEKQYQLHDIGERIAKLRTGSHMSQSALAQKVGLSLSTIFRLEAGKHNLNFLAMGRIAKELDVTLDYLFEGDAYD